MIGVAYASHGSHFPFGAVPGLPFLFFPSPWYSSDRLTTETAYPFVFPLGALPPVFIYVPVKQPACAARLFLEFFLQFSSFLSSVVRRTCYIVPGSSGAPRRRWLIRFLFISFLPPPPRRRTCFALRLFFNPGVISSYRSPSVSFALQVNVTSIPCVLAHAAHLFFPFICTHCESMMLFPWLPRTASFTVPPLPLRARAPTGARPLWPPHPS